MTITLLLSFAVELAAVLLIAAVLFVSFGGAWGLLPIAAYLVVVSVALRARAERQPKGSA